AVEAKRVLEHDEIRAGPVRDRAAAEADGDRAALAERQHVEAALVFTASHGLAIDDVGIVLLPEAGPVSGGEVAHARDGAGGGGGRSARDPVTVAALRRRAAHDEGTAHEAKRGSTRHGRVLSSATARALPGRAARRSRPPRAPARTPGSRGRPPR